MKYGGVRKNVSSLSVILLSALGNKNMEDLIPVVELTSDSNPESDSKNIMHLSFRQHEGAAEKKQTDRGGQNPES